MLHEPAAVAKAFRYKNFTLHNKKRCLEHLFLLYKVKFLYRKTFATAAGSCSVGVIKVNAFTIQAIRKIKFGAG